MKWSELTTAHGVQHGTSAFTSDRRPGSVSSMYVRCGPFHPSAGCFMRIEMPMRNEVVNTVQVSLPPQGSRYTSHQRRRAYHVHNYKVVADPLRLTTGLVAPCRDVLPSLPRLRLKGYVRGTTKVSTKAGTQPLNRPTVNTSSATQRATLILPQQMYDSEDVLGKLNRQVSLAHASDQHGLASVKETNQHEIRDSGHLLCDQDQQFCTGFSGNSLHCMKCMHALHLPSCKASFSTQQDGATDASCHTQHDPS